MSEISETEIKSMTKEQNYFRGYKDGKSDTLDKIRADVINIADGKQSIKVRSVLRIVDKYKIGSDKG